MPMLILLAAFAFYIYLELSLLVTIGAAIGVLPLILLLLFTSMIGIALIRSRGWYVMVNIQQQLQRGEIPTRSLLQAFLWLFAGILFLIPGLLNDLLAILLLLPFSAPFLETLLAKKIHSFTFTHHFRQRQHHQHSADNTVFEAEYNKQTDEDNRLH